MSATLQQFIEQVQQSPECIEFDQTMQMISENYDYSPTRFTNGEGEAMVINEAGTNEGSCKIFAFAQLQALSVQQTLALFGQFYRHDVLQHPQATDHANIRNFMKSGWVGIHFDQPALALK